MRKFVVIDSSPLIGLAMVSGLAWLPELFNQVYLSETVKREVLPGKNAPGEKAIEEAMAAGWIKIWPDPILPKLDIELDAGETDCINIALSYPQGQVLLVMDERAGRAVAKEKSLMVIGTAAIIGLAKKQGLISSAREVFKVLHTSDFRIAPAVINQILTSVGE